LGCEIFRTTQHHLRTEEEPSEDEDEDEDEDEEEESQKAFLPSASRATRPMKMKMKKKKAKRPSFLRLAGRPDLKAPFRCQKFCQNFQILRHIESLNACMKH
jgi:hypothetical protein